MTNFRNLVAIGATMAMVAVGIHSYAQDDLDDLLAALESESAKKVAEDPKPAADEPVAEDEPAIEDEPAPVAEDPVVDEPVAEDPPPTVEEPVVAEDEPVAEDPVVAEPVAEDPPPVAEEPVVVEDEPVAEDPVVDEPVVAKDEPVAEETPAVVAEPVVAEVPEEDEDASFLAKLAAEVQNDTPAKEEPKLSDLLSDVDVGVAATEEPAVATEEPVADTKTEEPAAVVAPTPAPARVAKYEGPDEELLENITTTERLRRQAFDIQARREISEARGYMSSEEYLDSVKHYRIALKLLNDAPASEGLRRECQQGIAEGYFRAAFQEESLGRRAKAMELMDKAVSARHPKARRQLEAWKLADDPDAGKVDISEITHRRNDQDYKTLRAENQQHLKRARQLLGSKELDRALDECELVLLKDPYNQEAIRIRERIQKKRATILRQERLAAREGMIADVDEAWRPVYAVDARELEEVSSQTIKSSLDRDPERRQEQSIYARMKEMRLPAISFKPPATIIDALDFFRTASRDFDRPDIPVEQRGFNIVFRPPETLRSAAGGEDEAEGFGASDDSDGASTAQAGVPVIPMIAANDITFYDALKLVCETVDYKFKVQGPIVMVMHKDMSTDEMVTRSYPVLSSFMDRMGSASSELKEMKSAGFGSSNTSRRGNDGDDENQERDWKDFFELLGVKWPEGSSIMYIKTIGKLRVKNTYENLAELEKALTEMNADPKLIEIETRFVEVCQDDLSSLGFEWILNSDYSLGLGNHISRALGVRGGGWGARGSNSDNSSATTSTTTISSSTDSRTYADGTTSTLTTGSRVNNTSTSVSQNRTTYARSNGADWIRSGNNGNVGVNAFGGTAEQQNGMRYLSTMSNHVSGESVSSNDQFVRVNAFLGKADISMILHMLSQRSDTDLLSAPKVLTRPGEEAIMQVITMFRYPQDYQVQLQSSSSSGSSNSGSQSAILAVVEPRTFKDEPVGVMLNATPTLTDDGNLIDLKINAKVVDEPTWKNYGMRIPFTGNSSLQNFQGLGEIFTGLSSILAATGTALTEAAKALFAQSAMDAASNALQELTSSSSENITYYEAPMEQPFFHIREIDSSVSVYPGATIVMGGLIREQRTAMDDKIPFLGDLPLVGRLFRSHAEKTSKRNLLIFVTTRLVDVRGREVNVASGEGDQAEVKAVPKEED